MVSSSLSITFLPLKMKAYPDVETYLADHSADVREKLVELRALIRSLVPAEATELINYGIPTFKLGGNLIHYGGFKKHVSLFPGASGVAVFAAELGDYKFSKGTIQFEIDKPLPIDLITRIVNFRIAENLAKVSKK